MNEFELIAELTKNLPGNPALVTGPGDDCAVVDLGTHCAPLLLKTDAVVDNVHFTSAAKPEQIGYKALARPLSDIAAMAGSPVAALISLGLKPGFDSDWVKAIYQGMRPLAEKYQVAIAGGETTRSPHDCWISVSLLGTATRGKIPLRSHAQPGDGLFVTGELGGSLLGKHLTFDPRIREGRWLAEHFDLHAMIDLSDGLAGDLRHILRASGVGAELLATAIPISPAAKKQAQTSGLGHEHALTAALSDGEDFELLFTVPARQSVLLLDSWKAEFPNLRLSCIGKIKAEGGLQLRYPDRLIEVHSHGYDHFA